MADDNNNNNIIMDKTIAEENKEFVEEFKLDKILLTSYFKDEVGKQLDGIILPLSIDNRQQCSRTDYQGQFPHCAGYAAAQYLEAFIWKRTGILQNFEPHQIYAKCKEVDGKMGVGGTYVDLALEVGSKLLGKGFSKKYKVVSGRTTDPDLIKRIIHQHDFICSGFMVSEDWYECDDSNFVINGDGEVLGGHAVIICGYDQVGVYIQNHWGVNWGAKGFAIIPWEIVGKQLLTICWLEER